MGKSVDGPLDVLERNKLAERKRTLLQCPPDMTVRCKGVT